MNCRIYQPSKEEKSASRGALLFYFGGGWECGTIDQFVDQCEYFSKKGLTCIVVDYRTKSKQGVTPFECIEDCKDSVKWVIDHGDQLDIDTNMLVLVGASAGGHIATTALLQNPELMDGYVHGVVLYNPVLDTTETGFGKERFDGRSREASPVHHLRSNLPKTLIFHGTDDHTVPFENSERFVHESLQLGNYCELIPYEGADHGFFNYKISPIHYKTTLLIIEEYLREIGVLS
jgi:acetyl esterase/lipase